MEVIIDDTTNAIIINILITTCAIIISWAKICLTTIAILNAPKPDSLELDPIIEIFPIPPLDLSLIKSDTSFVLAISVTVNSTATEFSVIYEYKVLSWILQVCNQLSTSS